MTIKKDAAIFAASFFNSDLLFEKMLNGSACKH